jgi:hypothetical protein
LKGIDEPCKVDGTSHVDSGASRLTVCSGLDACFRLVSFSELGELFAGLLPGHL